MGSRILNYEKPLELDDGDICTKCAHRRENHLSSWTGPYCHSCSEDDTRRRALTAHSFSEEPESYDFADSVDDHWHPECGECKARRARREFLSEMLQVMDTGVASFKMVRDLFDESSDTSDRVNYLTREVLFRIDNLRCAIKVELDGV